MYYILQFSTMGILDPGRANELRRLPAPLVDPGPRRLLPAPVRAARRAAGLQLRDRRPGARLDRSCASRSTAPPTRLIGLYAIGVFTSFTLSQSGMVRHWFAERGRGLAPQRLDQRRRRGRHRRSSSLVIAVSKFDQGVWIILVIVPILVAVDALHQARVRPGGASAWRSSPTSSSGRRTAAREWSWPPRP